VTNKDFGLSKSQMDFVMSTASKTLFNGGLGSGKTFGGAVWAVYMTQKYPKCRGVITANTYTQLRDATLTTFFAVLDLFGYTYKYNKQEGKIFVEGGSEIHTRSMEKYEALRGPEYGWAWSDECAFYKKEAFDVLIGRIRDARGSCQWKGTTTPNGFNWLYESFVETPLRNSKIIKCKTKDNLANLGGDYFDTLNDQYDSKLAQQELEGEFVNLSSGLVYYTFDRRNHVSEYTGDRSNLFIGLDFNVDPLCATYVCVDKAGVIHVVDETWLSNSNTFQAAKEIINKYPTETKLVIADETGNRRKTSANRTDHEILRRANLQVPRFKNPSVKDRYNNINRLLDKGYLKISPTCKKLIADLEKLAYDNKDPLLSHISDALGYVCWYINPLKRPKHSASVSYR